MVREQLLSPWSPWWMLARSIRDRFFEKYATSGKKKGTGLGTYSARLMAKTQGGDIELDSSKPGMTGIVIRLP